MDCNCTCVCKYRALAKGPCWRCRQGRHSGESQACECPTCNCHDANRLIRVAVVGGTLMICSPCSGGSHNLLLRKGSNAQDLASQFVNEAG